MECAPRARPPSYLNLREWIKVKHLQSRFSAPPYSPSSMRETIFRIDVSCTTRKNSSNALSAGSQRFNRAAKAIC